MNRKLSFLLLAIGLAATTVACGVVNNLVDRAVDNASEAVVEQIEDQSGEELPDLDALQATADAALQDMEDLEEMIPEELGATGESGFAVMEGAVVLFEDEAGVTYTLDGSTLDDVVAFYRAEFSNQGLTERDGTTVIQSGVASLIFDGDPSGQAVVLQVTDVVSGTVTVALRREDT